MVTGTIFKGLTFDGVDSTQYGVYITGEAVYNAPMRDVEMIEIPGRNGAYALDKGRFTNIEVTYPAGIYGKDESEFAQAISDFRNALCSRKGYCRLTDDYNTSEYRMAVYSSGLEVSPALLKAGQFDITFNCKPQRFLTSGETEQTIASGGTLTNPTLFDAQPLLAVKGYGNIHLNDSVMSIENAMLGDLVVSNSFAETKNGTNINRTLNINLLNTDLLNTGDTITISGIKETLVENVGNYSNLSVTINERVGTTVTYTITKPTVSFTINYNTVSLAYGTALTWGTHLYADIDAPGISYIVAVIADFSYNGTDLLTLTFDQYAYNETQTISFPSFIANSTRSTLGDPTYIDLDIGEAYLINDGEALPLNNVVSLGGVLPSLVSGSNAISYDNTITDLKITPRWWKV